MTFTYINVSEETDFGSEELIGRLEIAIEQGDSIRRNVAETPRMSGSCRSRFANGVGGQVTEVDYQ